MTKHRIAIFVSGTGSNARVMIDHFANHPEIDIALLISNKSTAKALLMAAKKNVPSLVLKRTDFYSRPDFLLQELQAFKINFIVLAGFLWLIPPYLVHAYPQKIVNIHPALLPKFGGKGMYGNNVHQAVKAARESESGMTVHYVDEQYDEGHIIFQAKTSLNNNDSPETIGQKVLALEHKFYSITIEQLLTQED